MKTICLILRLESELEVHTLGKSFASASSEVGHVK